MGLNFFRKTRTRSPSLRKKVESYALLTPKTRRIGVRVLKITTTRTPVRVGVFSNSFEDIKLLCKSNKKPCGWNDFSEYLDVDLGNCWQFNAGSNRTTSKSNILSGVDYRLRMFLYVNFNENLTTINSVL